MFTDWLIFLGERDVKKHVFGRSSSRKLPLEGYDQYVPVSDPTVDLVALKTGMKEVCHVMCLNQMLETTSESSEEDAEAESQTQSLTPEEIILKELQVCILIRMRIYI